MKVDQNATILIPVPKPLGGALIVGVHSITYHDGASERSIKMKPAEMQCYGIIDARRYLLGDQAGELYILHIVADASADYSLRWANAFH